MKDGYTVFHDSAIHFNDSSDAMVASHIFILFIYFFFFFQVFMSDL